MSTVFREKVKVKGFEEGVEDSEKKNDDEKIVDVEMLNEPR